MDFQQHYKFFTGRAFRYLSRIVILYILSTIFKLFDHTFVEGMRVWGVRGQLFSAVYVVYGLIVWIGAIRLSTWVERHTGPKKLVILGLSLLAYGAVASVGFGLVYAAFDILLFHRYEAWESARSFSYDLNFGTFLFYLLILTFNGIIYYYKGWKEYQLQTERLMRENIQAKYDALRNQIDPHFFFNSLSVLTNLVYKSPDVAADYITQLAKTYRYILDKKFENLVSVQTELDFLDSYLFLIGIRHQTSIRCSIDIPGNVRTKGMIPPATLQLLVENAIKHNRFSSNDPLLISIKSEGDMLVISNKVRARSNPATPSGIGLENIHKRYELAIGKGIQVFPSYDLFIVKIPVILQS